ncbi:MAG: autotransporter domain-containing protein [Phycisphaerales bacterium]
MTNYNGYLGYNSNSYGSLLVTGEGSLWENSNDVHIGYSGEGDMKISDGGSVSNLYSYLGYFSGSKGEVTVSGPNAVWNTLNHLYVGFQGEGEVIISDGGKITSSEGYIGVYDSSTGSVTVTGADSLWENSDTLSIGHESDGTMNIFDGGKVTSTESYIGHTLGGTGNVSVDGIDSLWENSGNLYVGYESVGNMTISHSGKVTDANAFIGYEADSIGSVNVSVADVNAPPPTWENSGNLVVGYEGTGDMTISEGGMVTDSNAYIGYGRFSTGTVTVTGTDSQWQSSENLYVAYDGTGSMTISDGGKVMSKNSYVGYDVNSVADVNVAGADSLWQNSENLYVGYRSASDMTISDGGTVTALDSYIGYATGSEGSSVTVTGADSQWANSENLYVGYVGSGGMTVSNGGTVTGTNAYIGYEINSAGTVTVNEPNSLWENSENLYVAYRGTGDLNISDGGKVKGANAYIGYEANSLGTVTVSEPNALWENSENLYVGYGSNGSMSISGSGKVTDANAYIGYKANSTGSVSVTDVNSLWENSENLYIGYSGTGNMTISNHAKVMDTNAYIGYNADSFGTVTVSGPNSVWENTGNLYIGGSDTGHGGSALLNVKDEGVVQASNITNWSTGTIMGDGTLKTDKLTNKGVIKPGNSIGTLTIDGDMTIDTGSILEIEFETGDEGESDKLLVTGDLDILGGKVLALASGTAIGSQEYTIIEANSVTGTFDLLETVLLDVTLGYESNSVLMNITAMPFDDPSLALTNNQKELGSALQQIANRGGNSVTAALQRLGNLGELSSVYTQLAGLSRLSLAPATIAGTSKFTNTVAGRFQNLRLGIAKESGSGQLFAMAKSLESFGQTSATDANPGPYNYAFGNGTSFFNDQLWGIWCKGYGVFGDRDAEGSDVPGFDYSVKGAAFGLDYQLNKRLIVGITGGFSNGDVEYTSSKDESEVSSTAIGVYATLNTNNWYVDTILNFSDLEYETKRHIDMTSEKLTGTFDGLEITGYIEGGYNKHLGKTWILQPSASLQFTYLDQDGYKETGGPSALKFKAQDYESIQGSVGTKLIKRLDKNKSDGVCSVIELRGRYVYDLGDTESQVDASFASDPGTVFTISDEGVARDSMVFGIGFHSEINDNTKLFIDYDTTFNSDQNYHIISGGFQHRW